MPSANSPAWAFVTLRRSLRSPPAKKVFFAEVMITPVMSSFSASRRSTVAPIDPTYASFIVLADWPGSSRVRTTMPSSPCSQRIVVLSDHVFSGSSGRPGQIRSMMVAMPMPPPTHSVARP